MPVAAACRREAGFSAFGTVLCKNEQILFGIICKRLVASSEKFRDRGR
jgi:hypothetical protein